MTDNNRPTFRAALSNRTMQMTLGAFAFIAAAAGAALALLLASFALDVVWLFRERHTGTSVG